ncbi:MAG: thioredoxin domain-containing protein [Pseudomonadota bacterium]
MTSAAALDLAPAANLLGGETSPYLLQHRDNPVHWRPWGEAAFAEAKATNKPILLSVGYAACHWCHVMAHESFEDKATARLMNELFVNIKVDREERPDIDTIYMTALALMGEHGGWPLTMFLTPAAEPFWGGTYFPPAARYGKPAFKDVLAGIAQAWRTKHAEVRQNSTAVVEALRARAASEPGGPIAVAFIDHIADRLVHEFDPVHGGIAGAPKFPQSPIFELLWRAARRLERSDLEQAVILTLDRISQGGIYDHLGGGYARYSTDAEWLAPHFEKMLYDNAQLVDLLTLVWQHTKSPLYAARVEETIGWLTREMMAEGECFAAALDADSEGEEGKFYVWSEAEIDRLLGPLAGPFKDAYDVRAGGNWEAHTILNRSRRMLLGDGDHEARLARARQVLFKARLARVPPGRDDKVLADWNGLMIAALARAGFVFARPEWLALAERAFAGVKSQLNAGDGRLKHSFRNGRAKHVATLDDYANLARAAVALHEVTANTDYLDHARAWVKIADAHYWDQAKGGYFLTADDAVDLIARTKGAHDSATPAGNGTMAATLARLYHLTGEAAYLERAAATVGAFADGLRRNFLPFPTLINAAEFIERPLQVALIGARQDPEFQALLRQVATARSLPNLVLQQVPPGAGLPAGHPAAGKGMIGGRPTAYVCAGPGCSAALIDPQALAADLGQR